MGSEPATADYILEQSRRAGAMATRRMFGEYALYCDGKVVGFICDDQLYLKPTEAGRAFLGEVTAGQPYPRAKPHFLIDAERWEDAEWLADLIRRTARELPAKAVGMAKAPGGKARAAAGTKRATPAPKKAKAKRGSEGHGGG